jgi:predicted nuclease of predicted toxin-antitoxin system
MSLRFLFDEDFDNDILEALKQRLPDARLVRNQDAGLRTKSDSEVLEWAAANNYILILHDRRTLFDHFAERNECGQILKGDCDSKA